MAAKQAVDGAKIRDLRTKRGWSQEHLAKAAEIDTRTVQRVETGSRASFETLRALADAFQLEIDELLAGPTPVQPGEPARSLPRFLNRVRTGAELSSLIVGAHQSMFANDEPETQEEVDTIGAFFTELNEAAEIWNEMPLGMRLQAEFDFTHKIRELASAGFWVFAGRRKGVLRIPKTGGLEPVSDSIPDWIRVTVLVVRANNPSIILLSDERAVLPV